MAQRARALLLLSFCLCSIGALAQENTRNLSGRISDRSHEPLKGAIVQVENQSTHSVISYITNETGRYSFKRLQTDSDYSVWVTFRGQRSKIRTLSSFDTHTNPVIDFMIRPE